MFVQTDNDHMVNLNLVAKIEKFRNESGVLSSYNFIDASGGIIGSVNANVVGNGVFNGVTDAINAYR